MKFRFPIVIIDEDFRSENASGLGIRAPLRPDGAEEPYHDLLLGSAGRLRTLVHLFQLGSRVDGDEAAQALAPAPLDRLAALGLLERDGAGVRATAAILPTLGLLLASDWEPDSISHPHVRQRVRHESDFCRAARSRPRRDRLFGGNGGRGGVISSFLATPSSPSAALSTPS